MLAGLGLAAAVGAAPVGASLEPPAPRAEPVAGGQVLERALSGDVGGAGLPSTLPLDMRRDAGPAAGGRPEPAASAGRLPPAVRGSPAVAPAVAPAGVPAAAAAQVPSLLGGQLAGSANEAAVRPDGPKLARDWGAGGGGAAPDLMGPSTDPRAALMRDAGDALPPVGPLRWLSQGLAFIRENRMGLLGGTGALALVWLVQQARGRRRRA